MKRFPWDAGGFLWFPGSPVCHAIRYARGLPKFKANTRNSARRSTDNESGVDVDEILFFIDVEGDNLAPDEITSSGGVITAEFTPSNELLTGSDEQDICWHVTVLDIAGNLATTDSDDDTEEVFEEHLITIDRLAPEMDSAETGTFWDTDITVDEFGDEIDDKTSADGDDDVNSLLIIFNEDVDAVTVSEGDFLIDGVTPIAATVFSGAKDKVFITMAGAFDPDDIPVVKVVGAIGDIAGNTTSVDEIDEDTGVEDGIPPTFTVTLSTSLTNETVDLVITADEAIAGNVPSIRVWTPPGSGDEDGTLTELPKITGIKVTGTNSWEVEIDIGDDNLEDGDNSIIITGDDAAGNTGTIGKNPSSGLASDLDDEDDAIVLDPSSVEVHTLRANILLNQAAFTLALAAFQTALELDVAYHPARLGLAQSQVGLQQYAAARESVTIYLQTAPTDDSNYARGIELIEFLDSIEE
ncbi:MAG: hypothetical protein IH936_07220 [Acidobacteria bacterium]|nr:hypothetical protein [Acidobacteriota bacterium]